MWFRDGDLNGFCVIQGAGVEKIFWWRGKYSADDNTVGIGLLEHSLMHSINIME